MTQKTISVELARRKLGDKATNMSDKQIEELLNFIYSLCKRVICTKIDKENYGY